MMLKLLVVTCLMASCHGDGADSLAESLYGSYKLIYRWPKINRQIPNCSVAVFSKSSSSSISCRCARTGIQALLHIEAPGKKFDYLTEIVTSPEELQLALANECSCSPSNKARSVIYKVNEDYILQYIPWMPSVFLHGRVVPNAQEREDLISQFPDLKNKEGNLFCV